MPEQFQRTALLLGAEAMDRLQGLRVIVFGVGGVGGWCVEALVRSGVGHVCMVDGDCVDVSNINRQLPATIGTVGQPKVEVMRRHLLDINPQAEITARQERYTAQTADTFHLDDYDYVVDAIDSLSDKALLIRRATQSRARLLSSMGAARKTDPTQIAVAEFWQVKGCPLAAALRRMFRRSGEFPARKFRCVYSPELHANAGEADIDMSSEQKEPNGTLMHCTAIFGLLLAAEVIKGET